MHDQKQNPGTQQQDDWKKNPNQQQNPQQGGQQKYPQSDREKVEKDQQKKQA